MKKGWQDGFITFLNPLFVAICSFLLYTAATELRELRKEVSSIRIDYLTLINHLEIKVAQLEVLMGLEDK